MDRAKGTGGHAALDLLEGDGGVHQELDGDVGGGEGHGAERAVGGYSQQRSRGRSESDRDVLPIPWIDYLNHS